MDARTLKLDSNMTHRVEIEYENGQTYTIRNAQEVSLYLKKIYVSCKITHKVSGHTNFFTETISNDGIKLVRLTSSYNGVVSEVRAIRPFMNNKTRVKTSVQRIT